MRLRMLEQSLRGRSALDCLCVSFHGRIYVHCGASGSKLCICEKKKETTTVLSRIHK